METNYKNLEKGMGMGIISPDLQTEGRGCVINVPVCNKTVGTDVGGDFSLPDHLPDIRRLIKVDVKPSPASEFVSGTGVQLGGGIEYTALYQGTDGEIYGASFPGEYAFTVPFDDRSGMSGTGEKKVFASVYPDSAVSRVSGARRMNIKTRLMARSTVLESKSVDGGASFACEPYTERLVKKMPYCLRLGGIKDDIEIADAVDTSEEGVRYISSECAVFVEHAECGEGYADCRGSAIIKHLLCRQGGELYTVTNKIPFSETVEIDGCVSGSRVCVNGRCTDIGTDDIGGDGEGGLKILARINLSATAFNDMTLEYVKDIYSTRGECVVETESHYMPSLLACKNGNMTFSGYAENIGEEKEIADVTGSAKCEELTNENNKYTVSGKCRFGVIGAARDSGDAVLTECELPFRYEFEGEARDIARYECEVAVIDPRARWEGDGIQLDCELAIVCFALGENKVETVSSLKLESGRKNEQKGGFTVCYPDKNDSLWDVAKRYRVPVAEMATGNGIECVSEPDEARLPEGVRYMIV